MSLADLRQTYRRAELHETDAGDDPILLFKQWFTEAQAAGLAEPNAMTLATVSPTGHPSARTVLLKGLDETGFIFYTNEASRKGQDLQTNPHAALLFWWDVLERQVRIEGTVHRLPRAATEAYFAQRPRGSQLGAWASAQSSILPDRAALETRLAEVTTRFADGPIPCPPPWNGYRVMPTYLEFWQGRPNRLHDRLAYTHTPPTWHRQRLAP